jgi:hypothetical protein
MNAAQPARGFAISAWFYPKAPVTQKQLQSLVDDDVVRAIIDKQMPNEGIRVMEPTASGGQPAIQLWFYPKAATLVDAQRVKEKLETLLNQFTTKAIIGQKIPNNGFRVMEPTPR